VGVFVLERRTMGSGVAVIDCDAGIDCDAVMDWVFEGVIDADRENDTDPDPVSVTDSDIGTGRCQRRSVAPDWVGTSSAAKMLHFIRDVVAAAKLLYAVSISVFDAPRRHTKPRVIIL